MAKQIINIGTSANRGDGDPLRTAFGKINDNFDEVYSLLGATGGDTDDVIAPMLVHGQHKNVTVTRDDDANLIIFSVDQVVTDLKGSLAGDDSTILVDGVNSTINLDGTVKGNIIPDTDVAYDIGSATNRFRDLYLSGSTIDLGGTTLSVVGGELQLGGVKVPTQTDVDAAVSSPSSLTLYDRMETVDLGSGETSFRTTETNQDGDTITSSWLQSLTKSSMQVVNDPVGDTNTLYSNVEIEAGTASIISSVQTLAGDEYGRILVGPGIIQLRASTPANGTQAWELSSDGTIVFPDSTIQSTAWTGNAPGLTYNDDLLGNTEIGVSVSVFDFGDGTTIDMQNSTVLFAGATVSGLDDIRSTTSNLRLDAEGTFGGNIRIGTSSDAGYVILGESANNTHVIVESNIEITGSTTGDIANFNQYRVPTASGNTRLTGEFLEFQGSSQISAPLNGPYSRLAIDIIDKVTYESNGLAGSGVDTLVVPNGYNFSLDWKFWDAGTETVYDITGVLDNGDFTYTLTIPGYTFSDDILVTYILFNPTANDDATVRNIVVDQGGTLEGITGIVGASFLDGVGRISTPENGDLYIVSSTGGGSVTNVIYNNNATYGAYESHLGTVDFTNANRVLGPDKTPASSIGAVGDKAKEIAFDANYIYYCTADYDGVTHIWRRQPWLSETW